MEPYPLSLIVSDVIDLHVRVDHLHSHICTHFHEPNPELYRLSTEICRVKMTLMDILRSRITPTLTSPEETA